MLLLEMCSLSVVAVAFPYHYHLLYQTRADTDLKPYGRLALHGIFWAATFEDTTFLNSSLGELNLNDGQNLI